MLSADLADRLNALLEKALGFYREFLKLEQEKYGVVAAGRLEKLDACMKREQAFVLKARGLDRERQKLMDETPAPRATLREVLPAFPPEKRERAHSLYGSLSAAVGELQKANGRCQKLTRVRLNQISRIRSKIENNPELRRTYGESAKAAPPPEGFFSEKV